MCSNCSGDDLKPESFAFFDVSSPERAESFADAARKKRKRYRTGDLFVKHVRAALTQAICTMRKSKWHARIIGCVDPEGFVNLNLGGSSGEYLANLRTGRDEKELIEIRVSAEAIIEVFASCGENKSIRNAYALAGPEYLSAWEESCVERNNLRRTTNGSRRVRQLKYIMKCGAFVTFVALAVWCAVR
jgi:hypothetical protein